MSKRDKGQMDRQNASPATYTVVNRQWGVDVCAPQFEKPGFCAVVFSNGLRLEPARAPFGRFVGPRIVVKRGW